jgi:50S ribosome-binding GTPase
MIRCRPSTCTLHGSLSRLHALVFASEPWYAASASTSGTHRQKFQASRLFATANVNQPSDDNSSARKRFKEIPVHPSILEYIRSIGVGIPPRASKRKQPNLAVLNDVRRSRGRTSASSRTNRMQRTNDTVSSSLRSTSGESFKSNQKRQPQQHSAAAAWVWMPPPPFGPNSLPVQIIASVGPESVRDDDNRDSAAAMKVDRSAFPQNESLIAEIALAGRSNVGKSTLLNALLYDNRHESFGNSNSMDPPPPLRQRQGRRGRAPPPVKLPKGVKATMSSKPGETRRITFYKLQHVTSIPSSPTAPTTSNNNSHHGNLDKTGHQAVERRRLLLIYPAMALPMPKSTKRRRTAHFGPTIFGIAVRPCSESSSCSMPAMASSGRIWTFCTNYSSSNCNIHAQRPLVDRCPPFNSS